MSKRKGSATVLRAAESTATPSGVDGSAVEIGGIDTAIAHGKLRPARPRFRFYAEQEVEAAGVWVGVDKQGATVGCALGAGQRGREGRSAHPTARAHHGDGRTARPRFLRRARRGNARQQLLNLGGDDKGALRMAGERRLVINRSGVRGQEKHRRRRGVGAPRCCHHAGHEGINQHRIGARQAARNIAGIGYSQHIVAGSSRGVNGLGAQRFVTNGDDDDGGIRV
ncbi:hypothetical protein [uncultured Corynebacterium sp.]|uniref:hypothetical protein n=1 Tax=uncultured Corynebacterium sp. TaxID=159447 RepID=UPI0034555CF3